MLRALDSATGMNVVSFGEHITNATSLALSADGKELAAVTTAPTATGYLLRLWAADASQPQATLWNAPDSIENVCFSPDGKYVAASGGGVVAEYASRRRD